MNSTGATAGSAPVIKRIQASRLNLVLFIIVVLLVGVLPWILPNRFYVRLVNEIIIYGLLAMSLDVLLGYTGLLSFMHNAYLGVGAYATGLLLIHVFPESAWPAILCGVLITVVISAPIGWVQVRTGGLAFALLTVAFGMMLYTVAWKWYSLTGGDDGLMGVPQPDVTLFGLKIVESSDSTGIYCFSWAITLILFLLVWRIIHSPLGAVLEAIRENEERASFIGINVRRYKLIGWMVACGLAGTAGSLYILYRGYTGPGVMGAFAGAGVLMMVLLGGMRSLWGPFIGAAVFIFMQDYLSTITEHWEFFVGAVVILLVLFMPGGLAGFYRLLTGPRGE